MATEATLDTISDLVKEARAGNLSKARGLQVRLNRLHHLLFRESNPIPLKWALHRMKMCEPDVRLPLTTCTPELGRELETELGKLGLLS